MLPQEDVKPRLLAALQNPGFLRRDFDGWRPDKAHALSDHGSTILSIFSSWFGATRPGPTGEDRMLTTTVDSYHRPRRPRQCRACHRNVARCTGGWPVGSHPDRELRSVPRNAGSSRQVARSEHCLRRAGCEPTGQDPPGHRPRRATPACLLRRQLIGALVLLDHIRDGPDGGACASMERRQSGHAPTRIRSTC